MAQSTAVDFRPLAEAFTKGLRRQGVGGAAFAATVDGEQVVNLWGGETRPGVPWSEHTPAVTMSVTKGWAAMCVQILVDRELLDVDALVADYWPEYACNGKEHTTVRHVLNHQAGVGGAAESPRPLGWDGRGWEDLGAIPGGLAAAKAVLEAGSASGYHAVTYGWLVGELIRRVSGRTMGRFFAEEIARPLGISSAVGVDEVRMAETAVVTAEAMGKPPLPLRPLMNKVNAAMRDPKTLLGQAFLADGTQSIMDQVSGLLSRPEFFRAELPSSNGISSAADLARLYAVLACDGEVDGIRLLSKEVVAQFAAREMTIDDQVFARSCTFRGAGLLVRQMRVTKTLGYGLNNANPKKRRFGPSPKAYGSEGAGGQLAFCDPDRRVAVGFVRSALSNSPAFPTELVNTFYRCLG